MGDDLQGARRAGREHGPTVGPGLQDGVSEGLLARGTHHQIAGSVIRTGIYLPADEMDPPGEPEGMGLPLQRRAQRPVPDDHQVHRPVFDVAGGAGQCRDQHIETLDRVQAADRHHHPGLLRQTEALAPITKTAPAVRLRGIHEVRDVKDAPGRDPVLHQVVAKALGHGHEGLCVSIVLEVVIAAEARQVDRAGAALETRQAARTPEVGLDDRGGEAPQEACYPMSRQDVPSPEHRDLEPGHGTAQGQSHRAAGGMDGMDRPGLGRERLH